MISMGAQRREDLIADLEDTATMMRELAACRIIIPGAREKLNAVADLYEVRAANFRAGAGAGH